MNPRNSLLSILLCLFALLSAAFAIAREQVDYEWPTDASRMLTSTFGEYRSHRFHAGFDIKTFGQVGYKALAVRQGSVSRVEVSPWGYGRVVYLLLDTGETAIYGHLQKFNKEIAQRVRDEQQRLGRYAVELKFAPGEIPVQQGETIGWTGQSGSGAPHLHFELRDQSEAPLNPLLKGFDIKDTLAPSIRKVLLIPLDAYGRVAKDLKPAVFLPKAVQPGRQSIERSIPVYGRIAFALSLVDQLDGAQNKMNVYRYRLVVDDKEIFSARYDQFPYEINNQADLDRDYRALIRGGELYQRFFRDIGNELPFYASKEPWYGALECDPASGVHNWLTSVTRALGVYWDMPAGITVLEKGEHPFRIEVNDFSGNQSVVTGHLQVGPPERSLTEESSGVAFRQAAYAIEADYYDAHARLLVRSSQPLRLVPALTAHYSDDYTETVLLERSGKAEFRGGLPLYPNHPGPVRLRLHDPQEDGEKVLHEVTLNFITVRQGRAKIVVTQDGLCEADFSKESLFKSIFIRARTRESGAEKLSPVSKIYQIDPMDVPLKMAVPVKILVGSGLERLDQVALYRRAPGKEWEYIGRETGPGGSIGGKTRELGEFALLRDTEPPLAAFLNPATGARLTLRTPLLKASLHDPLSGIGSEENYCMLLDGERVIAEYDPEARTLLYQVAESLAVGRHTVELIASDRCGNEARRSLLFWIK
jgi:hypothetical protein